MFSFFFPQSRQSIWEKNRNCDRTTSIHQTVKLKRKDTGILFARNRMIYERTFRCVTSRYIIRAILVHRYIFLIAAHDLATTWWFYVPFFPFGLPSSPVFRASLPMAMPRLAVTRVFYAAIEPHWLWRRVATYSWLVECCPHPTRRYAWTL